VKQVLARFLHRLLEYNAILYKKHGSLLDESRFVKKKAAEAVMDSLCRSRWLVTRRLPAMC
jgi:hypothetical protein